MYTLSYQALFCLQGGLVSGMQANSLFQDIECGSVPKIPVLQKFRLKLIIIFSL
jgi:hypothetical protein